MHACMHVLCMYVCMYTTRRAIRRADRALSDIDASQVDYACIMMVCICDIPWYTVPTGILYH